MPTYIVNDGDGYTLEYTIVPHSVINGDFERGNLDYWDVQTYTGDVIEVIPGAAHSGTYGCRIYAEDVDQVGSESRITQANILPDFKELGFWYKINSTAWVEGWDWVSFYLVVTAVRPPDYTTYHYFTPFRADNPTAGGWTYGHFNASDLIDEGYELYKSTTLYMIAYACNCTEDQAFIEVYLDDIKLEYCKTTSLSYNINTSQIIQRNLQYVIESRRVTKSLEYCVPRKLHFRNSTATGVCPSTKQSADTINRDVKSSGAGSYATPADMYETPGASSVTNNSTAAEPGTNPHYTHMGSWISPVLPAQSLSGKFTIKAAIREGNAAVNMTPRAFIYIWKADNTKGSNIFAAANEGREVGGTSSYPTAQTFYSATTHSSVTIGERDRIVIEFETADLNSVTTSYYHGIQYNNAESGSGGGLLQFNKLMMYLAAATVTKSLEYTISDGEDYSSWAGYVTTTISPTPNVSGYQVRITVNYSYGNVNLDYSNLRFATPGGGHCPYYIESYTTTAATFWVKVPSGTDTLRVYYGNLNAVSKSTTEIFEMFDHFASTANWTKSTTVSPTATCTDSTVKVELSTNYGDVGYLRYTAASWNQGYVTDFKVSAWVVDDSAMPLVGWITPASNRTMSDGLVFNPLYQEGWIQKAYSQTSVGLPSPVPLGIWSSGRELGGATACTFCINYGTPYTFSYDVTYTPTGLMWLMFHITYYAGNCSISAEWARVRKFTPTEPIATVTDIPPIGCYKVQLAGATTSIYTTVGTTTWWAPTGCTKVRYLVVAGGGGGARSIYISPQYATLFGNGGGGAGGVLNGYAVVTSAASYSVIVGDGGTTSTTRGNQGSLSKFGTIAATGGGGGAEGRYNDGGDGGSGGGQAGGYAANNTPGIGIVGQGHDGGIQDSGGNDEDGGTGGGGAEEDGEHISGSHAGTSGGDGRSDDITGTLIWYAGGGGGGGGANYPRLTGGAGGVGGGGAGGDANDGATPADSGTVNTGGGGGGGHYCGYGGSGGSGIVIIKSGDIFLQYEISQPAFQLTKNLQYVIDPRRRITQLTPTVLTYTTVGAATINLPDTARVQYLIVGGGGRGGTQVGGGGGGSQVREGSFLYFATSGSHDIVVGPSDTDSSFDTLVVSKAGGHGGDYDAIGANGGSGGGGNGDNASKAGGIAVDPIYGYNGGTSSAYSRAGGGGGAGSAGSSGSGGAAGGSGKTAVFDGQKYGGGGGGGTHTAPAGTGTDGGGNGGSSWPNFATAGADNTGSGGGGNGDYGSATVPGGSGIIKLRYYPYIDLKYVIRRINSITKGLTYKILPTQFLSMRYLVRTIHNVTYTNCDQIPVNVSSTAPSVLTYYNGVTHYITGVFNRTEPVSFAYYYGISSDSGWCSPTINLPSVPWTATFDYDTIPRKLVSYRIVTYDQCAPSAWTFNASDDQSDWVTLDSHTSFTWTNLGNDVLDNTFTIAPTKTYRYYKLSVTDTTKPTGDSLYLFKVYLSAGEIKLTYTINASGVYTHQVTPAQLDYYIRRSYSPQRSLTYRIPTTQVKTKTLSYWTCHKQSATLVYRIRTTKLKTKSLQYAIKSTHLSIRNLRYDIVKDRVTVSKYLAYSVTYIPHVLLDKFLRYDVLTVNGHKITKSLKYTISPGQHIQSMKYMGYRVKHSFVIGTGKSLAYSVGSYRKTKTLEYTVIINDGRTRSTKTTQLTYKVASQPILGKYLTFAIGIPSVSVSCVSKVPQVLTTWVTLAATPNMPAGYVAPTWDWQFGDGTTVLCGPATISTVYHGYSSGTYSATVHCWSSTTNYVSAATTFTIDTIPTLIAEFFATPRIGTFPLVVNFSNCSAELGGNGGALSYEWCFFDDGPMSHEENPVHTFQSPGVYDIRLIVWGTYGSTSVFKSQYIGSNDPPVADFIVVSGGSISTMYDTCYTVSLTVTDVNGQTDTATKYVLVYIKDFVVFKDTSVGNIVKWDWDYGDIIT